MMMPVLPASLPANTPAIDRPLARTGSGYQSLFALVLAAYLTQPALAQTVAPSTATASAVAAPMALDAATSLPALLARVLARDPQVQVTQALLQATEQRQVQAKSRLGPTLGVSSTLGRSDELEFTRSFSRSTNRAQANLNWNLYNRGDDAAELAGVTRDLAAAQHDLRRAREEVAERIANAYAEVLRVEQLLPHSQFRLTSVKELSAQVLRQNELGKLSDADAQLAQTVLLDAEIAHDQLQVDHEGARRRLAVMTREPIRSVLPVVLLTSPSPDDLATPTPGAVAAASARAAAARERARPLSSLLGPRVDFEYIHQLWDNTNPASTSQRKSGWQVVVRWDFPVGGELQARLAEQEQRARAAQAESERVLLGIHTDLDEIAPRINNLRRAVDQLDGQIGRYDLLVRAGEMQFEAGRRSLAQLAQLHESRFNVQQRRAELANRLLLAQLRQLTLTGGLLAAFELPPL